MFHKNLGLGVVLAAVAATQAYAQTSESEFSTHWEYLTANDFVSALEKSQHTCLLPFGVVEKHGPAGPLGTDMMNGRYIAELAAAQEYTIIFPPYYFGQISEGRHQPGTLAYPAHLQFELMQATVEEMARNGCEKVIIQNSHGGNSYFLHYFAQAQMDTPHDYVVYAVFLPGGGDDLPPEAAASGPGVDGHAGEGELSRVMAHSPETVHPERSGQESGARQGRLNNLPGTVFTGIGYIFANFPNHYMGDSSNANAVRGTAIMEYQARVMAETIRAIKADTSAAALQEEFYNYSSNPVATPQ